VGASIDVPTLRSFASTPTDYVFASDFSGLTAIAGSTINKDTCTAPPPIYTSASGFDCGDIYKKNPIASSGLYWISVPGTTNNLQVYCDMVTAGGGWTVLQRRYDGSENFYRDWEHYSLGFGDRSKEFWLGNDNIAALTNSSSYRVRFDLRDWQGQTRYAEYAEFKVAGASEKYKLSYNIYSYTGNAGDSLVALNGMKFTTSDEDNDLCYCNCASLYRGAWWSNACHYANLNGVYNNTAFGMGVNWLGFQPLTYSLRFSEIKIRSANF